MEMLVMMETLSLQIAVCTKCDGVNDFISYDDVNNREDGQVVVWEDPESDPSLSTWASLSKRRRRRKKKQTNKCIKYM